MNRSRAAEHREDARLTQIMKAYAEKKGAEYLMMNEYLKQTAASESMEQSYEQGRETVRCGAGRCHRRRMIRRVLSAAAVIVLCLIVVTATALAVSPELRERVFRLFVEHDGSFSLGETLDTDIDPEVIYHYSDPTVPEGYTDMQEDRTEDNTIFNIGLSAMAAVSTLISATIRGSSTRWAFSDSSQRFRPQRDKRGTERHR